MNAYYNELAERSQERAYLTPPEYEDEYIIWEYCAGCGRPIYCGEDAVTINKTDHYHDSCICVWEGEAGNE